MKAILKWSRILNEYFIRLVLIPFYFVAFGISFLIFHLFTILNQKEGKQSFWKTDHKNLTKDFESAY